MKIVSSESGRTLPDNEQGEICARGHCTMRGYYNNPEATALALDEEGWVHTGDLGIRRPDGSFKITGRLKDMVIRGGENIYPREIDEVLYQHPDIAAAAAVGVPDDLYGEEVAAVVVLKPGASTTAQEVIDYCKSRLADFKCPKTVHFVDDIPKGPTGKLLKRELARMLSD